MSTSAGHGVKGVAIAFCKIAILAMVFHWLEARATLHEYALADGIRELLKRNDKGMWRSTPRDSPQYQVTALFNS